MFDVYQSVLSNGRAPERAEVLLEMVDVLYTAGYDDHLDDVMMLVATTDSVVDLILPTERLVCEAASELLIRLGVTVEVSAVYQQPKTTLEIIKVLLTELEAFDDYESLLAVMESGEPDTIILSNLVAFIVGTYESDYYEVIQGVSGKLMQVIRGILIAQQLTDKTNDQIDTARAHRAGTFLTTYPNTVLTDLIDDNGYSVSQEELISQVHIEYDTPNYNEQVALVVAGILFINHDTINDAQYSLDEVVELLLESDDLSQRLSVSKAVSVALTGLYGTENNTESEHDAP